MKALNTYINEWKLTDDSAIVYKQIKVETYSELRELIINRYIENNKILDLRDIDVSRIKSFGDYYRDIYKYADYNGCGLFYNLHNVEIIDVRGWHTKQVKSFKCLFDSCTKLREIRGIDKWNISNVNDMTCVFYNCDNLLKKPKWFENK